MPPHDSDSSDEGENYTETNVLLGFATQEETGDAISHLGGQPSWIDGTTTPSGALSKCKVCNGLLSLLLELNGDLPEHFVGHERRLYIWSCRQKTCRRKEGSVKGIRGVRVAKSAIGRASVKKSEPKALTEEKMPPANIGGSLFGVKDSSDRTIPTNPFSNPFSSKDNIKSPVSLFSSPSTANNPFARPAPPEMQMTPEETQASAVSTLPETFASKVRLNSPSSSSKAPIPHEPWPSQSAFPPAYPHYHLDAEYETLDAPSTPQIPSNARMDANIETNEGGGKEDKDVFESTLDKTFQKFADRVGQNAEQVLRYEFKGRPLLYSDGDAVGKLMAPHVENRQSNGKITTAGSRSGAGLPRCQSCGADRVFEMQLTPHAITELEAEDTGVEGMEWGTIILGVCGEDCQPHDVAQGEVGYIEEWVGVQWEELTTKR